MAKPTKMPRKMLDRLERIREKRSMREEDARASQARAERMRLAAQSRADISGRSQTDAKMLEDGSQDMSPRRGVMACRAVMGGLAMALLMGGQPGLGLVRASEPEPPPEPDLD